MLLSTLLFLLVTGGMISFSLERPCCSSGLKNMLQIGVGSGNLNRAQGSASILHGGLRMHGIAKIVGRIHGGAKHLKKSKAYFLNSD